MTLETLNGYSDIDQESSVNPDISDEERQEVKKLLNMFTQWKKERGRYDKNWMTYYKMFRGVQWPTKRPFWRNSEIINFIWQTIQSQIPLQMDVRPKFQFLPREPSDRDFADVLESISEADWEKNNWLRILLEVLYDGWIYGTSFGSMNYDPTANFGVGSASFKSEDIFYIYPDLNANDINDNDSEGLIYAKPVCTQRLKRRFPDKADQIKSDVEDFIRRERTDLKDFEYTHFNSDRQLPEGVYGHMWDDSNTKKTFVIEFFLKPKDTVEEKYEEEGEGGEISTKYRIKRKYPNGRHVVIANGMILQDEDLPYEDNKVPFCKFNNYVLPREFYGVSEVEQLQSPQQVFNKMLNFTLDAWALTGNPIWIADSNCGIDLDSGFTNVPGSVMVKNPGTDLQQVQGVGMNPAIMQVIDRLESWFNKIAGISDLQSGEAPGGVTAASAIEQLIQIQRTRVRQKQRNMDEFLTKLGRLYMNRVFEFYSVPQIFRITNKDGSVTYRKFRIDQQADEQNKMVRVAVFQDTEEDEEKNQTVKPEKRLILKGDFDIKIKSGSSLPFEIADIERKSLALFDRGIIDEEEVLDRLDVPNKEKILQRLAERQQAAAQAAAKQQGA